MMACGFGISDDIPPPGASAEGLVCPRCGCRHFLALETRRHGEGIRRRRECRNCGWRVWTQEQITPPKELED